MTPQKTIPRFSINLIPVTGGDTPQNKEKPAVKEIHKEKINQIVFLKDMTGFFDLLE